MPPKRLKSYTAAFKLEVVKKAESIGNRAASREYGVDERCIRRWKNEKNSLQNMPATKRARRGGKVSFPDLEKNLIVWIQSQRDSGFAVSTVRIRLRARVMAAEMQISNFVGDPAWCYRFMKRNSLSVRTKTTIGQQLPADWKEKEVSFLKYISELINEKKFTPSQMVNMDEVPLTFDCPSNRTVNTTGEKTVSITTTGNEKTSFTCVLACTADGQKLKPMLIFKRKTLPKGNFPNVIIRANEKGWMSESVMLDWLSEVWRKRKGSFFNRSGLLICDSMRAHLVESVKKMLHQESSSIAIIPGGLTKLLQPLDLTINRVFKAEMRRCWEDWMSHGLHSFTKTGRMKRASIEEVAQWVDKSWKSVKTETIINGFKKAKIIADNGESDISSDEDENDESESNVSNLDESILKLFESDCDESEFEGFE